MRVYNSKLSLIPLALKCKAKAVCVTTNGELNKDGHLVMGAGVAKELRDAYPRLASLLGQKVKIFGNVPAIIYACESHAPFDIISFPTKHRWREPACEELIISSARIVAKLCDIYLKTVIIIPAPGCGKGELQWEYVYNMISEYFDDRYIMMTYAGKK